MKKLSLVQLGCVLGVFAGSTAYAQVFNMQNINQGFHNYGGYNVMMFGQGAYSDPGNNIWNGFDNPDSPGSTDSFGGGRADDALLPGNPGNPYAHSQNGYWAPNSGAATTPVLFAPASFGNTAAGNAYSSGTLAPITVPILTRGFDSGSALDSGNRTSPQWIFSEASVVNTGRPGVGTIPGFPLGLCVLSNVPAGTYSLYLYGANYDGTRGAAFVVTNAGSTPLNGLYATMNPNAAAGSGPLTTYVLGQSYVEYDNVVPDANGVIGFTWGAVSNAVSTLTGEGDFNGLQLIKDSAVLAPASFVQQPFNSTFGGGTTATLFADARGNPAPAVEWWKTNADTTVTDTGQSGNTLSFPNVAAGNAGSYFAVAQNTGGSASSAVAVLGISTTPTIASQNPGASMSVVVGQSLTLQVSAIGPALTYNWYSNSVLVATTSGTPTVVNNGTSVDFSATASSATIGPFTASCTLGCTVVNTYSPSGVNDTPTALTVIPQLTGAYDTFILGQNPVAYWPLNESSGTTVYNYSISGGPALDGAVQEFANAPNVLGVPGPALFGFSGANTGISVGLINNAGSPGADLVSGNYCGTMNVSGGEAGTGILVNGSSLELTGNFTVAAWVLIPRGLALNNQGYLFGQQNSANGNAVFLGQNNNQNWSTVNSTTLNGGPTYADSNWHLWVFINNGHHGSNYIDNVLVESGSYHANATYNGVPTTTIGSDSPGGYTRNWNGDLCRMAVFNSAFTAAQVAALYNGAGIQPIITLNPPALVVANAGATAALGNVSAVGSTPLNYQWYVLPAAGGGPNTLANGGRFSGASGTTATNLVINPVLASDAGTYYATVNNGYGTPPTSGSVALTVNTTVASTIYAGQSPKFSMAAGAGPYVWTTNGVVDAGQTGNTYTLSTAPGQAPVAVYGENANSVYSVTNTVTIVAAPTDSYAAAVLADGPLAYFRLNEADNSLGDNGVVAHDYIGGNNGVYVDASPGVTSEVALGAAGFPYASPLPANTDTAAAFGTLGQNTASGYSGYSNSFAGYIPLDLSVPSGGNGEFSVEAWIYGQSGQHNGGIVTKGYGQGANNGSAGFFEQFTLQNADIGTSGSRWEFSVRDATGKLATFYSTSGVIPSAAPGWQHVVGVYDQGGSNTAGTANIVLYVNGEPAAAGATITAPTKGNGVMSTLVPVSIGAKQVESPSGNYDGQWNGTVDEVAIYPKALTSNQVQNHYFAAGIAPIITVQPTNVPSIGASGQTNAPLGSSVTLTTLGFGSPTLNYQWYDYNFGGAPIAVQSDPGVQSIGATTPTLTLKNVSTVAAGGTANTIGSGVFYCTVYNSYGTTNCATVYFTIVSGPPIITPDLPATTFAMAGQSAVFSAGTSGTFPQTNAWYYNNGATTVQLQNAGRYTITAGTSPTLTIANVTAADQGTYQLFVTNSVGYTQSTPSALVVNNEPTFEGAGTGWSFAAGSTANAMFTGVNQVQLTLQTGGGQVSALWYNTPLYVGGFKAYFTYTASSTAGAADGTCFVLQNSPQTTNAIGGGGGELGVFGIIPSVEFEMSLYSAPQRYGFDTDGASVEQGGDYFLLNEPPGAGSFNANGDTKDVTLVYNGSYLSITVSNEVTANFGATNLFVGDITQTLGTNVAYVGFTSSTGGVYSTQVVGNFQYTPFPPLSAAVSGNSVVLTWPALPGFGPYVLQTTHALPAGQTGAGAWTTIAGPYGVVNGNYQVTLPLGSTTFYQLFLANP